MYLVKFKLGDSKFDCDSDSGSDFGYHVYSIILKWIRIFINQV